MEIMSPYERVTLEAQIDALDRDTALRVTRLVFECSASIELALQAIQDANSCRAKRESKQPKTRGR
jgi:hypothetical protein